MLTAPPKCVAIIGAGLSGLVLASALHQQNIPCILYELRLPSTNAGGALMISPNALRLLDRLGIYKDLKLKGYNFDSIAFKNTKEVTTDRYYFGSERLYGYQALRVYSQILLTEFRNTASRLGIPVVYEKKFSHVVSESAEGVVFAFTDGSTRSADLLIGADGIHSSVRKYIVPDAVPKYMGVVAITCAARKTSLQFPAGINYPLPVSIHGKNGVFVIAPQDVDGGEVLVGTQGKTVLDRMPSLQIRSVFYHSSVLTCKTGLELRSRPLNASRRTPSLLCRS
jgi:2-polyprenyl-6-methoxyphenol hydroxylase-like FAD-dependent oxidoreductase